MKTYHDLISHMLSHGKQPVRAIVADHLHILYSNISKRISTHSYIEYIQHDSRFQTQSNLPWNFAIPLLPDGTPLRVNLKHKLHEGN